MKAMSPPSFTSLPIHQSLLYFWGWGGAGRGGKIAGFNIKELGRPWGAGWRKWGNGQEVLEGRGQVKPQDFRVWQHSCYRGAQRELI